MVSLSLNANYFKDIMFEILKSMGLNPSIVNSQVSKVMNSQIKYIPVRHHSPGSALLTKKALDKYKPNLVLIEGPDLANNLIKFMVDDTTIPPFAILSIFADLKNKFKLNGILSTDVTVPAKFQVYYPFISYSPELVALIESKKRNIPCYFIDLPLTGQIPFMIDEENVIKHVLKQEEEQFNLSNFYQVLAQKFQFNSFNETWDSLFEIGVDKAEIEQIRESILVFCSCVRLTIPKEVSLIDGSIIREQYMKYMIENLIQKEDTDESEVCVITGGMHSVVLPDTKPKKKFCLTKGLLNSLVPYSYYRISDSSGYGSGNQGPSFYDYIWQRFQSNVKNPFEMTALEIIIDVLADARNKGYNTSIADSINSFQSAKMLAMLRRRDEPTFIDIIDSVYMSLVKGNPELEGAYLKEIIRNRMIGFKIGRITKKMGRLPLQQDFYLKMEQYSINLEEKNQDFKLNLRDDHDLEKSQFFWRLSYLDLGILHRITGPDLIEGETGIFIEIWSLHWFPNVDVKLIELNIYGSTIEEASKNKLIEEAKKALDNFQITSKSLYQTLLMGLPFLFSNLSIVCSDSIKLDIQFITLAYGFNNCVMIFRFLELMESQERNLKIIRNLIQRSYYASCIALPHLSNPPQDKETKFVVAIRDMGTTIITITNINLDIDLFYESLKTCVSNSQNDFVKGCCIGILYLMNHVNTDNIKKEILEYTKSEDAIKIKLGEFIRGLIFECKSKLLFNDEVVRLLVKIIEELEWVVFNALLPSLRKAFSELEPREYEVFVEKIAIIYGLKAKQITELKENIKDQFILFFFEIDKKVRKVFNDWFGEALNE
ncbi:MAG: hypothetical protein EU532_01650 [Promethearchaeota archaeon]|nr:MAG: hypothetical protein EU532_01650 [Candidatus Lokiarchaeota archaeon]